MLIILQVIVSFPFRDARHEPLYFRTRNVSIRHGRPCMQPKFQMLEYLVLNLFAQTSFVFILSSKPLKLFNVNKNSFIQSARHWIYSVQTFCILYICSQNNDFIHFHKSMSAENSKFVHIPERYFCPKKLKHDQIQTWTAYS
jgi:hypothetical protein